MGIHRKSVGDYFDERIEAMKNEIARLSRDRVLFHREAESNALKAKYTIQEITVSGDSKIDISADARQATIRIPVEHNKEMTQLLKLESHGGAGWLDLDYRDGFLSYVVPADGEPSQVKKRIENMISHITNTEIDPRKAAIRNGNERVISALNQRFDQLHVQFRAQDERRSQLEEQLK